MLHHADSHTICAVMTSAVSLFFKIARQRSFDRGLKPGDRWCLCAPRWQEAFEAGQAPLVVSCVLQIYSHFVISCSPA